jgi:hypothetical protein
MMQAQTLGSNSQSGYGIQSFSVDKQKPRSDEALSTMAKVVDQASVVSLPHRPDALTG